MCAPLEKAGLLGQIVFKQLIRCVTSIGANVVEAQSGSSKKDFINFYTHALKSANEAKYWLALVRDSHLMPTTDIRELLQEAMEISNMLGSSVITMKGRKR